jgi:hypothetical protein
MNYSVTQVFVENYTRKETYKNQYYQIYSPLSQGFSSFKMNNIWTEKQISNKPFVREETRPKTYYSKMALFNMKSV